MQLVDYLSESNLQEPMQSAYRNQHSTETAHALLQVQHDNLEALSGQKGCLMVLLDLSAVFDISTTGRYLPVLRISGLLVWFIIRFVHT